MKEQLEQERIQIRVTIERTDRHNEIWVPTICMFAQL
jgi:hypothetical protein